MIRLLGAFLALIITAYATPTNPAEPLPIDYFLAPPAYRLPKLSPDGRSYGIVLARDEMEVLTTVDLTTDKATPVAKATESKIANYWWKGRDLILLLLEGRDGDREFQTFDLRTQRSNNLGAAGYGYVQLVNPLPDEPENVLISTNERSGMDLKKLNVRTGKIVPLQSYSDFVERWLTDQKGRAVAGFGRFHEKWFMLLRDKAGSGWRRLELGDKSLPDFLPTTVAPDQHDILGFDYTAGDTVQAVAWNPDDDSKRPVWQSSEVDPAFNLAWGEDWTYTRAIAYETDRFRFHYLSPEDRTLAEAIDGALPQTVNGVTSISVDGTRMIVFSTSDTVAGNIYLFDKAAKRLAKLGATYANTEPARLVPSRYFTCQTRDGLPLHGLLYLPPGSTGPVPAVLYVGDPAERSHSTYQPFFQLLASRGFAVIQLDHRGKGGYGKNFIEAGNRAVAGAMADDLVDGLDRLVRERLIDPSRIAILGEDRGGLLAAQALMRHPDRFAAWINLWTPMDMSELGEDEFVFGRFSKDEIKTRFGGKSARRQYLQSLDPLVALPKISVPSFHFYPRNIADNSLLRDGDRLEKQLAKLTKPKVFMKGQAVRNISAFIDHRDQNVRHELKRAYTELLAFLNAHLAGREPTNR